MGFSPRYHPPALIRTFAIAIALVTLAGAAGPLSANDVVFRQIDSGALVIMDGTIDRSPAQLASEGVTVVRNMGLWHIAVAGPRGLEYLDREDLAYRVVDESIVGKTYYTAAALRRLPPLRSAGAAELAPHGRILYQEGSVTLVEATPAAAEALPGAGFDIARVYLRPVHGARTDDRDLPRRDLVPSDRSLPFPIPTLPDTLIQAMVDAVSVATIDAHVQRMQDFVTRWAPHDSCQAAADWIYALLESYGVDSVYFQNYDPTNKDNVIAVKLGTTYPNQIVIIGGHYDSVANNAYDAPGADDNASGTACVLECARILSAYDFSRTIVFVAFGGEEQGLMGSEFYASQAAANGDDIVGMINVDMIGYLEGGDVLDLDIIKNNPSLWLRDRAMSVAAAYVPGLPVVDGNYPFGSGSDQQSFWDHGYDAISLYEDTDEYSPYIHTPDDRVGVSYNSPALAEQSVRVAVALVADLAGPRELPSAVGGSPPVLVSLEQNVPNPFNPRTMIRLTVPSPGGMASLVVYDVAGRKVVALLDNEIVEGSKTVWWDGRTDRGETVASGVYFYRLTVGRSSTTRKMILLR